MREAQALAKQLAERPGPRPLHDQAPARRRMGGDHRHGARHGSRGAGAAACRPRISTAPTRPSPPSRSRSSRVTDWLDWPFFEDRHRALARADLSTGARPISASASRRRCRRGMPQAGARSRASRLPQAVRRRRRHASRRPQPRHRPRNARAATRASPISPSPCRDWARARSACSAATRRRPNGCPRSPAARPSPPSP